MDQMSYVHQMLERTRRHMDEASMARICTTVFAVAGLGGVGAVTVELLARWGVRRFRLLDMDRYEPSNLNRQLFATSKTLGRWKVDVAAERILEINPYAEVELKIPERVDNENVHRFVRGAGMVIQNADYPSAQLFYVAAREYRVPLVNGYATVTGGRVQIFDYRTSACTSPIDGLWRRLKYGRQKVLDQMSPQEIELFDRTYVHPTAASINFVTNMVGCWIVAEAIKLLTGLGRCVVYPRYMSFDVFRGRCSIRHTHAPWNPDNITRVLSVLKNWMSNRTSCDS